MAATLLAPGSANGARGKHAEAEHHPSGAMSPATALSTARDRVGGPRKLILCFDGTGNKFHGDESDSNILKIFRMLDRAASDQYQYYQPGIGTYVVSRSFSHTGLRARVKSWYLKAKDSAIGTSFDQHVVGGYRFLMRYHRPGDDIYMFGFSRGAYIARFLAEMLDHVGLLSHGNEEMVMFAWKAFAQWQCRRGSHEAEVDGETLKMHEFMKGFRETFSRPVGRIRFLGLFDTVNSVPRFETAWMQRSKFPYTARSSARVIRHAVSIDERRAKFRQDLMYQRRPGGHDHHRRHMDHLLDPLRRSIDAIRPTVAPRPQTPSAVDAGRERRPSDWLAPGDGARSQARRPSTTHSAYAPYRPRPRSRQQFLQANADGVSCASSFAPSGAGCGGGDDDDDDDDEWQDIDEVWFSGGHGDVGGGWEALDGRRSASHVPLAWMVREAMKAGLPFDMDKVVEMGCVGDAADQFSRPRAPDIRVQDETNGAPAAGPRDDSSTPPFHADMHRAHTSIIHDSLEYGRGLGPLAVTAWKFMEWLPFRRMDLQGDGSWKPIRWPLPRGEVRDMPDTVRVHGSVIRRLREDETYRPGNLIVGGGGRGVRRAAPEHGIGEWVCVAEHGDPIGEVWVKKSRAGPVNGQ